MEIRNALKAYTWLAGLIASLLFLSIHVGAVESVEQVTAHQESGSTDVVFSWTIAPDDPDQVNGAFAYELVVDGTASALTNTPIAERAGWLQDTVTISNGVHRYVIRASDGFSSADSCAIDMNVFGTTTSRYQGQCGVALQPVLGVAAQVTVVSTTSNVTVEYSLSASDPEQSTGGDFAYQIISCSQGNSYRDCLPPWIPFGSTSPEISGNNSQTTTLEVGPVSNGQRFQVAVRAFDWRTHRTATFSCEVEVILSQLYSKDACGDVPLPGDFLSDDGPQMPFVRLPVLAPLLGMTVSGVAVVFGAFLVAGVIVLGFRAAGVGGALVGAGMGCGAGTFYNLIPLWVTVIVFMAAAGFIIWQVMAGGSND